MTRDDLIERVARAIASTDYSGKAYVEERWRDYQESARAAISAMPAAAEIERLRGETLEQARLLGMSGEREAKLVSEIERLRADNAIYEEQEIRMECWIEQRDAEIKLLRAALWRSAPPERKP
jgi:hypothetical protein